MSIVITGITGCRNRGVEALIGPTLDQIRQQRPTQQITVLTHTPDYDAVQLQEPGVKFEKADFQVNSRGRRLWLRKKAASLQGKPLIIEPQTAAATAIREAALVIASGGDVFSSDYGSLQFHLAPLKLAQRHHLPVVFLAHSIGPFHSRQDTEAWLNVARQSLLVTARESLTYQYLVEELGLPADMVHLTADPAFLLMPPPRETTLKMLKFYGLEPDRPTIALAVSQGVSRFAKVSSDDHFQAWTQVIQKLLEHSEIQLLLIPHVQSSLINNDDRLIATRLLAQFDYNARLHLVGGIHSAAQLKGLIAACDMVIAERMHAAVAGLSSRICTVVIGYSVKADGIMKDLLGNDLNYQDFLMPIEVFVKDKTAHCLIQNAWQRRHEVESCLEQVLPQIKARAAHNFDLLESLMTRGGDSRC